jgi:hypothetical protein
MPKEFLGVTALRLLSLKKTYFAHVIFHQSGTISVLLIINKPKYFSLLKISLAS